MNRRALLTTLSELVGIALISAGCSLVWLPLALIVPGIALVLAGVLNG